MTSNPSDKLKERGPTAGPSLRKTGRSPRDGVGDEGPLGADVLRAAADALSLDGYAILRGVIDREVIDALANLVTNSLATEARLWQETTGIAFEDSAAIDRLFGPAGSTADRFQTLSDDLKHLARGELPLRVRLNPMLKRICDASALIAVVRHILSCDRLRLHNPPSIRISMPGRTISNVPPHQDWAYNRHVADFITAWVPLTSVDDSCGGTDVYAGSHCLGQLPHRADDVIWSQTAVETPDLSRFPRRHHPMEPGDVLLFVPFTLHASRPNRSERTRLSIDYRFFDAATPTTKHCYDIEQRRIIPPSNMEPGASG